MRAEHKEQVRSEVSARVIGRLIGDDARLAEVLGDTIYNERVRLETMIRYPGEEKDIPFWAGAARTMRDASSTAQKALLEAIVHRFLDEVTGHFDPRVYGIATRVLPTGLGLLLNSLRPKRILQRGSQMSLNLDENVIVKGETEAARRLVHKGTVVVVPTHQSNLDSIVVGYSAYLMGLPPLLYGAGLNLFVSKVLGFFMGNLGAYRVDRRKKSWLYKEVLKEYATFAMELGYHSLFFPGGTRNRSGEVERKLKKGLLGSGLQAYVNNLCAGRRRPNVYFVPATLSYGLVLEASTLIEDHLQAVGKSRYIILDDEFSRPKRIAQFMGELLGLNSRIYVNFGQPLDPFGNRVDFQGRSVDPRDRIIDIRKYVSRGGVVTDDPQRDHEYTTELASSIVRSYAANNRLQATNLTAFVVFLLMRKANPRADLYRILREGTGPVGIPLPDVHAALDRLLAEVRRRVEAKELLLDPALDRQGAEDVLASGLSHFRSYHRSRAARREAERIHVDDAELCLYYHNRMTGYGLEPLVTGG